MPGFWHAAQFADVADPAVTADAVVRRRRGDRRLLTFS
jgi:hypothetical protein